MKRSARDLLREAKRKKKEAGKGEMAPSEGFNEPVPLARDVGKETEAQIKYAKEHYMDVGDLPQGFFDDKKEEEKVTAVARRNKKSNDVTDGDEGSAMKSVEEELKFVVLFPVVIMFLLTITFHFHFYKINFQREVCKDRRRS